MSSRFFANALTVAELAQVAALSPRQFSRAFRAETGQTPAKAVEQIRPEAARPMLEETPHPMEQVARESGFSDLGRMREAFMRQRSAALRNCSIVSRLGRSI